MTGYAHVAHAALPPSSSEPAGPLARTCVLVGCARAGPLARTCVLVGCARAGPLARTCVLVGCARAGPLARTSVLVRCGPATSRTDSIAGCSITGADPRFPARVTAALAPAATGMLIGPARRSILAGPSAALGPAPGTTGLGCLT